MITTILGPPGTGKTHKLIEIVKEAMSRGVDATKIGYFAFTNRASDEARDRIKLDFDFGGFPYFRTLHSLAFNQLGLTRTRVFSRDSLNEFANWLGLELSVRQTHLDEEFLQVGATEDDRTLFLIGLAAVSMRDWKEAMSYYEWERSPVEVLRIWDGLRKFKKARSLIDFNDMLTMFLDKGPFPKLDMIIIDETQDLSTLQFMVVEKLIEANPNAEVWFAGDDDQAIYEWAGADVTKFLFYTAAHKAMVLEHSYRVPVEIKEVATRVIDRVKIRVKKPWLSPLHPGKVTVTDQPNILSREHIDSKISFLFLARYFHFLRPVAEWLEEEQQDWGYLHQKPAKFQLSTIHGAKGAQADVVILDLAMTQRSYDELETDAEKRVWYTAITRAKHELVIIEPYTRCSAEELVLP